MRKLELHRVGEVHRTTLGVLLGPGVEVLTLEMPWNANRRNLSCIPVGSYAVKEYISPTHGQCLAVLDVPGRSDIQIHAGNTIDDTEGCILPGLRFGRLNGQVAVLQSGIALKRLMLELNGDEILVIS